MGLTRDQEKAMFAQMSEGMSGAPFGNSKKISDSFPKRTFEQHSKEQVNKKIDSFKRTATGAPEGNSNYSFQGVGRTGYKTGILGVPQGDLSKHDPIKSTPQAYIPKHSPLGKLKAFNEKRQIEAHEDKRMRLMEIAEQKKELERRKQFLRDQQARIAKEKELAEKVAKGEISVKDLQRMTNGEPQKLTDGAMPKGYGDKSKTNAIDYYKRIHGEEAIFPMGYKTMSRDKGGKFSFALPKSKYLSMNGYGGAPKEANFSGTTGDNPLVTGDSVRKDLQGLLADPTLKAAFESGQITSKDLKRLRKNILRQRELNAKQVMKSYGGKGYSSDYSKKYDEMATPSNTSNNQALSVILSRGTIA